MSVRFIEPSFTPEAKEAQQALYPAVSQGLRGFGLVPGIAGDIKAKQLSAFGREVSDIKSYFPGQVNRFVPRADVKVRGFLDKELKAQFARGRETIERDFDFNKASFAFNDEQIAQQLAFGLLGSEKGVATSMANLANESTMRRENAPDFSSALAGGLGSAAGIFLGGRDQQTGRVGQPGYQNIPASQFGGYNIPSQTRFADTWKAPDSYRVGLGPSY